MTPVTLALVLFTSPAFAGDKDGDGVPNKTDTCKEEAEDVDQFEDEDGCPDPDNDGDGLLDGDDKCPNEAEDKDGFQDEDGCPDPDNDGDGVGDADDKCPDEKENDDVKDGCIAVTYAMINEEGWVPAMKTLNDGLAAALKKKKKGCEDAATTAKTWLDANDADALHANFVKYSKRAPADVDVSVTAGVLDAQATFWDSAKTVFEIYCKEHESWPTLSPKIDAAYMKAKKPE